MDAFRQLRALRPFCWPSPAAAGKMSFMNVTEFRRKLTLNQSGRSGLTYFPGEANPNEG